MSDPDALAPQRPAGTVAALRAALEGFPDDAPIVIDGAGILELVQRGQAGAAEVRRRTGFVDDPETASVEVVWLLGEARAP